MPCLICGELDGFCFCADAIETMRIKCSLGSLYYRRATGYIAMSYSGTDGQTKFNLAETISGLRHATRVLKLERRDYGRGTYQGLCR